MNIDRYRMLRDEIGEASAGFSDLGTSAGSAVHLALEDVFNRLDGVWQLIQQIERAEREH